MVTKYPWLAKPWIWSRTRSIAFAIGLGDSLSADVSESVGEADESLEGSNAVLLHAVYHMPNKAGIDEACIWGDYFYLEALMRLRRDWLPYW